MAMTPDEYMQLAIELSEEGALTQGKGGPFGAVIVQNGNIIGKGFNRVPSTPDPSAHGEVTAIRNAALNTNNFWLEGAELYTSCEPCPMCLATALWAHIAKIRFAANRFDAANIGFDDEAFYRELQIVPQGQIIVLEQMLHHRDAAWEVMQKWHEKENRKKY